MADAPRLASGSPERPVEAARALRRCRQFVRLAVHFAWTDMRHRLEALVADLDASRHTVALLGRVSTGKSSLINTLIGREWLPVGVTPVTAIETRIVSAPRAAMTVEFEAAPAQRLDPAAVAGFVTERGNPGNRRGVTRVTLELPVPQLGSGLMLIDTQGLGALAATAPTMARTALIGCDLAVLVLDAAGSLGHEEADMVRSIIDQGSDLLVVIGKADLLSEVERGQITHYLQAQLRNHFGRSIPVSAIGSRGRGIELTRQWMNSVLLARIECVPTWPPALTRRVEAIASEIIVRLQSSLASRQQALSRQQDVERTLSRLDALCVELDQGRSAWRLSGAEAMNWRSVIIERAVFAASLALADRSGTSQLAKAAVVNEIDHAMSARRAGLINRLQALLARVDAVMAATGLKTPSAPAPQQAKFDHCPHFDVTRLADSIPWLASSRWAHGIGPMQQRALRRRLRASLPETLQRSASAFDRALCLWNRHVIEIVRHRVDTAVLKLQDQRCADLALLSQLDSRYERGARAVIAALRKL